ncbi:ABC transporter substrate-binding protein [Cohnella silvisoli]|uniref:Extracellular solute-binding protein n=1 Tax=Cohnella silvisoli TaxID=2873699 RepID=A0ABV1KN35_9BACL|nr:extracellular solute-binding protein [Cohnella silvisoli]MCD9020195.1 extracellular solute-binding protein [Cohnella silvisoli]
MLKKVTGLLMAIVMVVVLAACGGGNDDKASSNSPSASSPASNSAEPSKEAPAEKVTLKIIHWINEPVNKYYEEFNKKFTERYPNITVDYQVVPSDATYDQLQQTRINANDTDLLALKSGFAPIPQEWAAGAQDPLWKQWIDTGLIADLSNEEFVKSYNPVDVQNSTTYNGKVYGINMGKVAFSGLYYNKKIFADNNLKVPTTWDEFKGVVDALKAKDVTPLGFAGKDIWPYNLAVQGLSASVIKDQGEFIKGLWTGSTKFTDANALEVLEKAQYLLQNSIDGVMGIDYASLPSLFASGKVAMIADGTWNAPTLKGLDPTLEFGYFPIPGSNDAAQNGSLAGKYDMSWMVLEKSKNKDAALKWLAMQSEPENYAAFAKASGFLPTQNVQVEDPFINEISPYLANFKLAWDQLFINRQNAGEHVSGSSVHAEFLSPAGPIKTPKELAELSQKEWDAAK